MSEAEYLDSIYPYTEEYISELRELKQKVFDAISEPDIELMKAAYEDAMNKYYYENAQYDKTVQDINAKTSLIQQQDRTLELRLKQLDTEQNALKTEMEAVKKVVEDNIKNSFDAFKG